MTRLNLACCDLPLPRSEGWINVDNMANDYATPDIVLDCTRLDEHFDAGSVDEIYAGHFVEHLTPEQAEDWVAMCRKVLKPGGKLGFVTPDIDFLARDYLAGNITLERFQNLYVFSYDQPSHHASIWNLEAQRSLLERHGFSDVAEIDRRSDDRLAYPADWQCGCEGRK